MIIDKPAETDLACVTDRLKESIVDGDVIFTEGYSFKSSIVRLGQKGDSRISHTGFLHVLNGKVYVTHMSIDDDVIMSEPIDAFIQRSSVVSYQIRRWTHPINKERFNKIIDSLLTLKIRFDNEYNMQDDTEYYCTELVCKVLMLSGNKEMDFAESDDGILYPHMLMESGELARVVYE